MEISQDAAVATISHKTPRGLTLKTSYFPSYDRILFLHSLHAADFRFVALKIKPSLKQAGLCLRATSLEEKITNKERSFLREPRQHFGIRERSQLRLQFGLCICDSALPTE